MPCIMRWKGQFSEGLENNELLTTMDFFPTFSELSSAEVPQDLIIDGKSFTDVILNNKTSKNDYFYYYAYTHLQAVRDRE